MASFKAYLNNNAPFLNARDKWQAAGSKRAAAQARWEAAKETDANYDSLLAAFKTAQEDERIAKAIKDAAEDKARVAYNKIEDEKKAKEQKKKDAVTQKSIDTVQAEVDKYTNAGLAVPADKQEELKSLKNKLGGGLTTTTTTTTSPDAGTAGATTGTTTTQVSLEDFLKNLNDNPTAVNQVKSYLGMSNLDGVLDYETISKIYAKEKEIETLSGIRGNIDRLTYYAETKGTGTGGPKVDISVSSPTQAISTIQTVFKSVLGREATPEELSKFTVALNNAERKAGRKTRTVGGRTETTTDLDRVQFLTDEVKKIKDPKTGKSEYEVKKGEKESLTSQDLMSVARANGINLSQDQLSSYLTEIRNGRDINVIKNNIRNIAGYGMPDNIKKILADGTDLETIYAPYRQTMASVLELNPTDITLDDSVLRSAIGPDKELPLYEFKKMLKKDSRWQYTNNAREEVSDKVLKVLRDFGFQG